MRVELSKPLSLAKISNLTNGILIGDKNAIIKAITTDSRELQNGDMFIAIKGERFDGADYISDVKKRGGFVLSPSLKNTDILHPNSADALLSLAHNYIKTLPYILYKIAITGSVGKTTTKEFLKILLSNRYITHASSGNFNNQIGMPMSVLSASQDNQILIIEMGMNHPGEISKLSKCLCPDKALITNIGTAHIGNLGSRENIARAKMEITDGMNGGILLVPDDEPLLKDVKNKIVFSFTDINADYFMKTCPGEKLSFYKNGVLFSEAMFSVIGEHNKKCLLAAVSLAIELGLSSEEVSYGISLISGDNTRQKTFCKENLYFFTDFYNASRESVLAFIKSAEEATTNFSKSLFLGDILELGNMSDEIHFEIGKAISPEVFSSLFLFGKSISETYRGAVENGFPPDRIFINQNISNPLLSAMQIRKNCSPNDMIFMKASRGLRLERILDCFS